MISMHNIHANAKIDKKSLRDKFALLIIRRRRSRMASLLPERATMDELPPDAEDVRRTARMSRTARRRQRGSSSRTAQVIRWSDDAANRFRLQPEARVGRD